MISIMLLANAKELAHPSLENLIQNKFERASVEIPFIEGTKLKPSVGSRRPPWIFEVEIPFIEGTKLKLGCLLAPYEPRCIHVEIPFIEGTKLKPPRWNFYK